MKLAYDSADASAKKVSNTIKGLTADKQLENLVNTQMANNTDRLTTKQLQQVLATRGVADADRAAIAEKIKYIAAIQQKNNATDKEIAMMNQYKSEVSTVLNESGRTAGLSMATGLITAFTSAMLTFSQTKAKGIGDSIGTTISTTLMTAVSGVAMTGNPFGALLGLIPLASAAIGHFAGAAERAVEKMNELIAKGDELASAYKNLKQALQDNATTARDLVAEYHELQKGVDANGKNISLTADKYERYKTICNDLASLYPELTGRHTSEGTAIVNLTGSMSDMLMVLERVIDKSNEFADIEFLKNDANDVIAGATAKIEKHNSSIRELRHLMSLFDGSNQYTLVGSGSGSTQTQFQNSLNNIKKQLEAYNIDSKISGGVTESGIGGAEYEYAIELTLDAQSFQREIQRNISSLENQIAGANFELNPVVDAMLRLNFDYNQFDVETQNFVNQVSNKIDWNKALDGRDRTKDNIQKFMEENIIRPLADSANPEEVKKAIAGMYDPKHAEKSIQEYVDTIIENVDKLPDEVKTALAGVQGELSEQEWNVKVATELGFE